MPAAIGEHQGLSRQTGITGAGADATERGSHERLECRAIDWQGLTLGDASDRRRECPDR
jgi:hypothetical protein